MKGLLFATYSIIEYHEEMFPEYKITEVWSYIKNGRGFLFK